MEENNSNSDYKHKSNSQNFNNLAPLSGPFSTNSTWEGRDPDRTSSRESTEKVQNQEAKQDKGNIIPDADQATIPIHQQQQIAPGFTQHPQITSMPQQQQMASAVPQHQQMAVGNQQMMQQPPYPPYSYNGYENNMDHNGICSLPNYNMMMPTGIDQWCMNNRVLTANSVQINSSTSGVNVSNGKDMPVPGNGIGAYSYMNVTNDPSMFKAVPTMPGYYPFPVLNGIEFQPNFNHLETIVISKATLQPPLPGEKPKRHERPPGCRTVYVGYLPEKITEEIVREIFTRCGAISTIRMSKSHFCHIRFADMETVDQALLLSGFRIKIEGNDDPAYNSKIHVDYASARDDQRDYECQQRALEREKRHRQQQTFHPPSPPPVVHYSELEAKSLGEKLRNEQTFKEALHILITWLERGECNKKSAESFYLMIKSVNGHVIKLNIERENYDKDFHQAKQNLENKLRSIQLDIKEIIKVFKATTPQKVWDHFSRPQRSQIKQMKDNTYAVMETISHALVNDRVEEEMDLCDEDKSDEDELDESLQDLYDTLNRMNSELAEANQSYEFYQQTFKEQQRAIDGLKTELEALRIKNGEKNSHQNFGSVTAEKAFTNSAIQCGVSKIGLSANETRFVSLIATFLHVHPFGASIDYICSYLNKIDSTVSTRDVENLLKRFPVLFKEKSTGIGATLEKKWTYIVLNS
ncbi:ecto-NOX disulfide-thiol exchanger 1 [Caerostris darwini]|uniref:Ecto-NOX disulfide-thiol exchanger 1 n=1 Tax=Caerostris darwini TaxID=1538125 RepID=A0AAV4QJK2_9ARAC|nr:ecto-NOX disulfide-thiol exchanger 1 [Caerostris darwini]